MKEIVLIGAGAVIKDSIKICLDATVGAGTVIVKNIEEPGPYAGWPQGTFAKA